MPEIQPEAPPAVDPHLVRGQRVAKARDRFVALVGFYRCAQAEIAHQPFAFGVDPDLVEWTAFMTPVELVVWSALRHEQVAAYPQYPVGRFFVDFAVPAAKLAIECDGSAFQRDWGDDGKRQMNLDRMGWSVMHIAGADCLTSDRQGTDALYRFAAEVRSAVYDFRIRNGVTA